MGGEASQRGEGTVLRVTGDPTRAATFERQVAVRTGVRGRTADSIGAALGHLDGEAPVVAVVADADLADADGVALLEFLRAERPALPVLLRTDDAGSRTLARAARAGVTRVLPAGAYDGAWETVTTLLERAVAAGGRAATAGGSVAADRPRQSRQNHEAEPTPGGAQADGPTAGTEATDARPLLDGTLDGIVVTVGGDVQYANRRAREAFDVTPGAPLRVGPSLDGVESVASVSADGGWRGGDGPRPVERRRTAMPGQGAEAAPVDLTATRIRWAGATATMAVLREPGPAAVHPADGRVAALEELLDRLGTDLGTILGGTELLRDGIDDPGRPHLDSLISTATAAVARAETAGEVAGLVRSGRGPAPIQLRPVLEGALETVRASDPAADLVVEGSIPAVSISAAETIEPALAVLLLEVADRDDAETVRISASLPEQGTALAVRVAVEDGGGAADDGTTRTADPDGSESGGDEDRVSVLAHLLEAWGGSVRVIHDGTGGPTYVLDLPTATVGDDRLVDERLRDGELV